MANGLAAGWQWPHDDGGKKKRSTSQKPIVAGIGSVMAACLVKPWANRLTEMRKRRYKRTAKENRPGKKGTTRDNEGQRGTTDQLGFI